MVDDDEKEVCEDCGEFLDDCICGEVEEGVEEE